MVAAVGGRTSALYARRALEGNEDEQARAAWRLEAMLPELLTIERAQALGRAVEDLVERRSRGRGCGRGRRWSC